MHDGVIFDQFVGFANGLLVLFALQNAEGPQKAEAEVDPYSISAIRFVLATNSGGRKFIHNIVQKRLPRLGDCVSIALLKILKDDDLKDSRVVRDFLPIIRNCFSEPQDIGRDADKEPKVTLFLLNHAQQNTEDEQLWKEIQQTIDFVREKTAQ